MSIADQARVLVEAFFDRLAEDLDPRLDLPDVIRERQRRLIAVATDLPDAQARTNLEYSTAVLAAYRVLQEHRAEPPCGQTLIDWLTAAFVEPMAAELNAGTKSMLDDSPDPFAVMTAYARRTETEQYGAEFTFVHSVDSPEAFHTDVRRCGYHDYLVRNEAPELTRVLCAFDANWYEAIDPKRHGFRFHRETTIGLGGRICPFHFDRVEAPDTR